jgi:hypothetical protein
MTMYKCRSLVTAEAVISRAMQFINSQEGAGRGCSALSADFRTIVESYQNGREQGLIAWPTFASHIAYYICEPRHGDAVCIYTGQYAMQSISDDAYHFPKYFDNPDEAAEWLVEDLIGLYKSIKLEKAAKVARKYKK